MPLFWELQNIRMGIKFAISGVLLIAGIIAIAVAYYQTIVIDEQSQSVSRQTRQLAEDTSRLDFMLVDVQQALTEARLSPSDKNLTEFAVAAENFNNGLKSLMQRLRSNEDRQNIQQRLDALGLADKMNRLVEVRSQGASPTIQAALMQQTFGTLLSDLREVNASLQLLTDVYADQDGQARTAAMSQMIKLFFASLVVLGLALAIALAITKYGVLDPVQRIQDTVDAVRAGDTEARTRLETKDELGQMATVLDTLLDEKEEALAKQAAENKKLNASIIELIQSVFKISQRDLTVRVPVAEDITGAVADSINQLTNSIENVLREVSAVTQEVNSTSIQVKTQSEAVLLQATKEQEEINETLEGLDSAIQAMQLIAKLAAVTNSASQKAISTSENAKESVSATIDSINKIRQTIHEAEKRIKRLGERSQEIGGIINLINNISERTHILSLNASMHAASAGEAGRGLMVVVDEVQRLAENSREATSEIESLVNNIQLETADTIHVINTVIEDVVAGTRLAEQAGERMEETRATTQSLVESVVRIAQNATGQAKLAQNLRQRAGSINEFTQATNSEMLQQKQLSERLVGAADELQRSISVFKLQHSE
ncbi:methyl-accepting chemotaxis protein [Marinobacterium sediminicola]|uniref:Twitching motility protein PilJ n=1 Tax=Marinobacterium sediminicola TaxID=518898 RepID=A0ABY1RYN4_9GAMM|nr:methyl-accepting chemotaxis protein [Marinobacterium sediminicola]ULG68724.1 methyl-accepting chemotaxis protein [Marinobacterium sediminicola]SMR73250.1 twitching motility protein PilJ [Marinobacterium sediminicola]